MLCQQCNQNQATIHITKVINGQKSQMNLCGECAKEHGAFALGEISSLFSGLLGGGGERVQGASGLRCSRCGLEFGQFKQTGMLGCAHCYADFRKHLQPVLQRIHGRLQHEGRIPVNAGEGLQLRRQIEAKRREMQAAIDREEFEQAAKLRDELRALQTTLEKQGEKAAEATAENVKESMEEQTSDAMKGGEGHAKP